MKVQEWHFHGSGSKKGRNKARLKASTRQLPFEKHPLKHLKPRFMFIPVRNSFVLRHPKRLCSEFSWNYFSRRNREKRTILSKR